MTTAFIQQGGLGIVVPVVANAPAGMSRWAGSPGTQGRDPLPRLPAPKREAAAGHQRIVRATTAVLPRLLFPRLLLARPRAGST